MGMKRKKRIATVVACEPKPRASVHYIRADHSKLTGPFGYSVPDFYYDEKKICVDCRNNFVFTAEEQQTWYERYKIPYQAVAVRCHYCAKQHRFAESLKAEYDQTARELKLLPRDPDLNAEFGRLVVVRFEMGHLQKLDAAIAALRRAIRSKRCEAQAYYWLGRCYENSGQPVKSREMLTEFLNRADAKKGELKPLMRDARNRLENK